MLQLSPQRVIGSLRDMNIHSPRFLAHSKSLNLVTTFVEHFLSFSSWILYSFFFLFLFFLEKVPIVNFALETQFLIN